MYVRKHVHSTYVSLLFVFLQFYLGIQTFLTLGVVVCGRRQQFQCILCFGASAAVANTLCFLAESFLFRLRHFLLLVPSNHKLVEGDVLTHLNGSNARLLDFSDILKACRGPERGGLPRPLVMKFSRSVDAMVEDSVARARVVFKNVNACTTAAAVYGADGCHLRYVGASRPCTLLQLLPLVVKTHKQC